MSNEVFNVAKRGRGRPRKQDFTVREPCDAPVIELTSSSDEDEPPPRPVVRKPQPVKPAQKPPILVKRTPVQKPAARIITPLPLDKAKTKPLTDTEALLSILESNADDLESLSDLKDDKRTNHPGGEKLSEKKDNLFKSIEEELRSLHHLDDEDIQLDPSKPKKIAEKRRSVEIIEEIRADLRKMKDSDETRKNSAVPTLGSDAFIRRIKTEKGTRVTSRLPNKDELKKESSEITRIHRFDSDTSPSKLKLPPEVLQAIKKRANLGRIEKIVEKTDGNKKSKYIVIFNKGSTAPKKKSSIEEEIEELLKSLPEKPPSKKIKLPESKDPMPTKTKYYKPADFSDVKSKFTKLLEPKERRPSYRMSDIVPKTKLSAVESQKSRGVRFPSSKGSDPDWLDVTKMSKKTPIRQEEPFRFTESPISHEPPLPWDGGNDEEKNFEKYFKTTETVVENHDSLDSESEYEEPEMLSHFKTLKADEDKRPNDAISVTNITNTITREFPGWTAEPLPGTDTICLVRLGLGTGGVMSVRKQIKIDSEYNVSVIVNNISIPEYEGLYDSFDNIKQLVREIDQL